MKCATPKEREQIRERVMKIARFAALKNRVRGFKMPRIVEKHTWRSSEWPDYKRKRGTFVRHRGYIRLNLSHLCAEPDYQRTFAHEISHVIARKMPKGKSERSHGETWQSVMRDMGQPIPEKYFDPRIDKKPVRRGIRRLRRVVARCFKKNRKHRA